MSTTAPYRNQHGGYMMDVKMEGFDELADHLDGIAKRAEEVNGQNIDITEALTPAFMSEYTDFASFDELLATSSWKVETAEDFAAIPDAEWDAYIAETTKFSSWEEMQQTAATEYFAKKIGL